MEDRITIPFAHNTIEYSNYIVADRIPMYPRQSGAFSVYYNLRTKQWLCDLAENFIRRHVQDAMFAH